ncbi:MAG: hypothetical protein RIT45_341 [Pseudomonadota bacterium]
MRRTRRRSVRPIVAAIAALVVVRLLYTVWVAGEFRVVQPRGSETCHPLPGVVGGEDFAVDRAANGGRGVVWIAADDRRAAAAGRADTGHLYRLDADGARAVEVTPDVDFPLHPHGLSFARTATGTADDGAVTGQLLVVNHRGGGVFASAEDAVERFHVIGERTLRHVGTVQDPLLRPMNDLAALPDGRFYASLDHGNASGVLRKVEDFGRFAWSGVAYWDGRQARQVVRGLRYANGVALSADAAQVYVATTVDRAVLVYDRDVASGELRERARIECGTGVDNLDVAPDGSIWVGAHPKLLTFLRHARDPGVLSPSEVLRIDPEHGTVESVLEDDGSKLPGAAVAVLLPETRSGPRLLVGPVFAPHLLDCRPFTPRGR